MFCQISDHEILESVFIKVLLQICYPKSCFLEIWQLLRHLYFLIVLFQLNVTIQEMEIDTGNNLTTKWFSISFPTTHIRHILKQNTYLLFLRILKISNLTSLNAEKQIWFKNSRNVTLICSAILFLTLKNVWSLNSSKIVLINVFDQIFCSYIVLSGIIVARNNE